MFKNDIEKLEKELRSLSGVEPQKKAELIDLVETVKSEASRIAQTRGRASELMESLKSFEGLHPRIVGMLDEACRLLGEIGI